jgi:signal transduction histidine kinase
MTETAPWQSGLEASQPSKFGRAGLTWGRLALYLAYFAIAVRGLAEYAATPSLPLAVALLTIFLVFFVALPRLTPGGPVRRWLVHGGFLLAATSVVALTLLPPSPDFVTGLLVLLSFRAAHAFAGRTLLIWLGLMMFLIAAPLVVTQGLAWGVALALSPIVGCVALPAYVVANRQIEAARAESESLVADLQEAHRRLQIYSEQAAELAALEEHNRLIRQLHDSVSQALFSINLTASAVQLLLARDPALARSQLEYLQGLTQSVLADMRRFIAQLRPQQ